MYREKPSEKPSNRCSSTSSRARTDFGGPMYTAADLEPI